MLVASRDTRLSLSGNRSRLSDWFAAQQHSESSWGLPLLLGSLISESHLSTSIRKPDFTDLAADTRFASACSANLLELRGCGYHCKRESGPNPG